MSDLTPEQSTALQALDVAIHNCARAFDEIPENGAVTDWIIPVATVNLATGGESGEDDAMIVLMSGGRMPGWKALGLLHGGLGCIEGYVIRDDE